MVDPLDNETKTLEGFDMVAIPEKPELDATALLSQWYVMQQELKKLKNQEMALRKSLFSHFFPDPKEGTNTAPLPDSWVLKGGFPITREVDVATFQAMREDLTKGGVPADTLVEWKPSLKVTLYKELTAEQRAVFDRCLIIKPGSPSLSVELPAKAKKAAAAAPAALTLQTGETFQ